MSHDVICADEEGSRNIVAQDLICANAIEIEDVRRFLRSKGRRSRKCTSFLLSDGCVIIGALGCFAHDTSNGTPIGAVFVLSEQEQTRRFIREAEDFVG